MRSTKDIIDPLNRITARGHNFSRVYSDWLALTCHALCKQEDEYMEMINRYRDNHAPGERNADFFADAFAAWQMALQAEYRDYLGEIFEQYVTRGENGQFFTPEALCKLMAHITGTDGDDNITILDGQRISDPACGSARNLLAITRLNRYAHFQGVDIDLNCVRMSALNLLCRNVDGEIIWGNALSLEAHGGYRLRRTLSGGEMTWIEKEEAQQLLETPARHAHEQRQEQCTTQEKEPEEPEEPEQKPEPVQYGLGL